MPGEIISEKALKQFGVPDFNTASKEELEEFYENILKVGAKLKVELEEENLASEELHAVYKNAAATYVNWSILAPFGCLKDFFKSFFKGNDISLTDVGKIRELRMKALMEELKRYDLTPEEREKILKEMEELEGNADTKDDKDKAWRVVILAILAFVVKEFIAAKFGVPVK